ncbi:HIRAN domain-containing protein [Rhodoglobus vestalii]|nr:HIRAN domain-containing protein [Rhodoglobus vestalii]
MGFLREAWRVLSARPERVQDVISPAVPKPKLSAAERSAIAQEMVDAEAAEPDESHWDVKARVADRHGISLFDVLDEHVKISEAEDRRAYARENPAKVAKINLDSREILDLRSVASTRMRVVGSANWVTDKQRAKYGGTDYLLVREPKNKFDVNAVAVYGKGRKMGYISAAKAAALAPILDPLPFDSFQIGGTSVIENSIRLWVDVPKLPDLRNFVKTLGTAQERQ